MLWSRWRCSTPFASVVVVAPLKSMAYPIHSGKPASAPRTPSMTQAATRLSQEA